MRFQATVFSQLMQSISRSRFKAACQGRAKWGLSDWAHLVVLVAAQFSGARSLRDLERLVERHGKALSHLGIERVRRTTLADANATRSAAAFEAVAADLARRLGRGRGREAVRLIDATRIWISKRIEAWSPGAAIKLTVVYDPQADRPTVFVTSPGRTNDVAIAKHLPIEPGATYVFDRGYYGFAFWKRFDEAGCRFVTRTKHNTPLQVIKTLAVPEEACDILSDRLAFLPERLSSNRHNPYDEAVRVIDVRISTGRIITLLSNDLDAPAREIAELYKARWQVELFFKWIKQNLKIRHFLGASPNAVRLQIIAAVIAYLLVRLAQVASRTGLGLQACARLIGDALLARRPIDELLNLPPPTTPVADLQYTWSFPHA